MTSPSQVEEREEVADFEWVGHYSCPICYPYRDTEIKALCGKVILGVRADPDAKMCPPCARLRPTHLSDTHWPKGGPR